MYIITSYIARYITKAYVLTTSNGIDDAALAIILFTISMNQWK